MKNRVFLIFMIFTFPVFATEQTSDLLIIDNDTIYLQSFPLEELRLKKRPFFDDNINSVSSDCWRGYIAVWKIYDNKLYLEKILRCHHDPREDYQDIKELFSQNQINFQEENGMILADWISLSYYESNALKNDLGLKDIYLYDIFSEMWYYDDRVLKLKFTKGKITTNNLKVK